jgi:hypothetical protein
LSAVRMTSVTASDWEIMMTCEPSVSVIVGFRRHLAGWAMVSITAAVARIRMSFSPGAISTP